MTGRLPLFTLSIMAGVLLLPMWAEAQPHHGGTHVAVGVSVGVGGPYYYRPYCCAPFYGSIGFGYGYGYPYGYWYPAPYYYGGYPYYYYDNSASLRIEVMPRQTEVFVDGFYAGIVDNFDGTFQRLNLEPGDHELQLFLPGHRMVTQRVYLQPRQTFKVRYTMEALGPGESEPVRPANAPPAPTTATAPAGPVGPPGPSTRLAPAAPAAPASSNYGTLAIRVQPGEADILIDGDRWEGASGDDRLVVQLAPGTHHIEVRKAGYRGYMTEVTIRAGITESVNVALAR